MGSTASSSVVCTAPSLRMELMAVSSVLSSPREGMMQPKPLISTLTASLLPESTTFGSLHNPVLAGQCPQICPICSLGVPDSPTFSHMHLGTITCTSYADTFELGIIHSSLFA